MRCLTILCSFWFFFVLSCFFFYPFLTININFYTSFDSGEPKASVWLILSPSFTLALSENRWINQNNNKKKNSQNVFFPHELEQFVYFYNFFKKCTWTSLCIFVYIWPLLIKFHTILSYVYKNRRNPIIYYWSCSCVQKCSASKWLSNFNIRYWSKTDIFQEIYHPSNMNIQEQLTGLLGVNA